MAEPDAAAAATAATTTAASAAPTPEVDVDVDVAPATTSALVVAAARTADVAKTAAHAPEVSVAKKRGKKNVELKTAAKPSTKKRKKDEPTSTTASEDDGPKAAAEKAPAASVYNRLDEADLEEAQALGLLRPDLEISHDASKAEYGIAYEKNGGTREAGCGTGVFAGQKRLQERCKQFAMMRGFQLIVACSSTRSNGGGNVKYRCKKLHGQQFLDPSKPASEQQCPFYINGYGKGAAWKVTRVCFVHNHYKFIGWRNTAVTALGDSDDASSSSSSAGAQPPVRLPTQRNTTISTKTLCKIVTDEVNNFPAPSMVMSKLDGKMVKRLLLTQGHTVNHMMASRIKRQLQEARFDAIRTSFQKLASYLKTVAKKNPGSYLQLEMNELGVFKRALFIPSAAMHALKHCRKIISLDHITPAWQEVDATLGKIEEVENDDVACGVYLKAMSKDFNDDVVTFALALVVEENQANWEWFLNALQRANQVNLTEYTVVAGRSRGLQQALQSAWPQASHHFCMRRIIEEDIVLGKKFSLTQEKKHRIYDLARSESESEFNSLRAELLRTSEPAIKFLDGVNKANWVKYAFLEAFRKPTFNEITCDLSMSLGNEELFSVSPTHLSWFGEDPVRSSQPLETFNLYFLKLAENFNKRLKSVELRSPQELVPMRAAQLTLNLQGSQRCESIPCANGAFMVRSLGQTRPQIYDTWRHVNLLDWECTCQEWQDRLFPCVHGVHASELDRRRIDSLYSIKEHSVEYYKEGYSVSFTPWPMEATTLAIDFDLKTPLDNLYADEGGPHPSLTGNGRPRPGPRPKSKKEKVVADAPEC